MQQSIAATYEYISDFPPLLNIEDIHASMSIQVKRRNLAMDARKSYQKGKDPREVRDKTLSYAEFDLP